MTSAFTAASIALVVSLVFESIIHRVSRRWTLPRGSARRRVCIFGLGIVAAFIVGSAGVAVLFAALAASSITDLESGLIFDAITIPTLLLILMVAGRNGAYSTLVSAAACAGLILVLFVVSRGRGIGLGDLKLAACIGAGVGVGPGVVALGVAFILGAVHGVTLFAGAKIKRGEAMRFAPYLAAGTLVSATCGNLLWQ